MSNEELVETPDVSADMPRGEGVKSVTLEMESIADTPWIGMLELEPGFDGTVKITVKGIDLVGNPGEAELEREFEIPSPIPRPSDFSLGQNYPNPVREDTSIPYQLPVSSQVTIRIYNTTGQLVRTLEEGYKVACFYGILTRDNSVFSDQKEAAYWDGRDDNGNMAASGIYFYHLKAGSFEAVRKMIVSR